MPGWRTLRARRRGDMISRFERSRLPCAVPIEISDAELERRLYGAAGVKPDRRKLPEPDWATVARELKRKHVTLQVLWDEYFTEHPDVSGEMEN